ncbi:MAG TPA: carboxypeptidase regulatory-like domain-containing protein [Candidatus Polarisedimenticolia bacterium]|nr:carboxypeptidase regulatory-like domain-containing protein [Candidatus Polarisedimenticolia bacterium]
MLTGQVVAAESEKPLAGAWLEAYLLLDSETRRELALKGRFVEKPLASAAADASGTFRLAVPPGSPIEVIARVPGRLSLRFRGTPSPSRGDEPRDLGRLALPAGRRIQGKVVDAAGKPLAGVQVVATPPRSRIARPGGRIGPMRLSLPEPPPPVSASAVTSADGAFVLEGLPRRGVTVRAHAAGMATAVLRDVKADAGLLIKMGPGHAVAGRVMAPDGKPAPGAWVLAGEEGLDGIARCDEHGAFRIEHLAGGERTLVASLDRILVPSSGPGGDLTEAASHAPSAPLRLALPSPAAAKPLSLSLRPGGIVRARALDAATRKPLAEARLTLEEPGDSAPRSAVTAAGGEVVFIGIPVGSAGLRGEAEGFLEESAGPLGVRAGQTRELTVALSAAASIEGTARDAAGRPVGGAKVTIAMTPQLNLPARIPLFLPYGDPVFTDMQGRFSAERLPAGKAIKLSIESRGFSPWAMEDLKLRPGERRTGLDALLDAGRMITGRILDPEGRPVAGASVSASRRKEDGPVGMVIQIGGPGGGGRRRGGPVGMGPMEDLPEVVSADDGVFRIHGALPGSWSLVVAARGFAPRTVGQLRLDGAQEALDAGDVRLEPGAALRGRVVSTGGAPVAYARGTLRKELSFAGEFTTGADGSFVVEDLEPRAPVDLSVQADGYGSVDRPAVSPPLDDLTIELPPASRIAGQVVDEESRLAVTDFAVSVARNRTFGGRGMVMATSQAGSEVPFHSEDGAFLMEEISPGKVDVTVRSPGYEEAVLKEVEVPEGKDVEGLVVTLERATSVAGSVVDDHQRPLPGVSVAKAEASSSGPGMMVRGPGMGSGPSATTDGEGRFALEGLERGPLTLAFTHPEFEPAQRDVDTTREVEGLRVAMSRGGTLTGIVVREEDGSPVARASVTAQAAGGGGPAAEASGPDGTFTLEALRPGRYTVRAAAPGLKEASIQDVVVAPGDTPPPLELRLGGGVTLQGMITGAKEKDLAEMTVTAFTSRAGGFGVSSGVDAAGRFELRGLAPGSVTLTAGAGILRGGRSVSRTVEIPDGVPTFETTLEFPRGHRVDGTVTRGDRPLEGATVIFSRGGRGGAVSANTDASGRYTAEDLEEGEHEVDVLHIAQSLSYETKVTVSADRRFDIEMPLARLTGVVSDAATGKPLSDAVVSIKKDGGQPSGLMVVGGGKRTDSTGVFAFEGLDEGVHTVSARREGYAVKSLPVRIVPLADPEPVSVELDRTDAFTFRAVDAPSGLPLAGVHATVLSGEPSDPLAPGAASVVAFEGALAADGSGAFRFDSLRPGTYTLILRGQGLATRTVRRVGFPGPEATYEMEPGGLLELRTEQASARSGEVRGVLLDPNGLPVYTARPGGDPVFRLRPDQPVTLGSLAPGLYRLRAAMPGGGTIEKQVTVAAGSQPARVTLP